MTTDVLVAVFAADENSGLEAEVWSRLQTWLQPEEHARAASYKDMDARAAFLIGRGMARTMLFEGTGVMPAAWRFAEGAHGRPEIQSPATSFHFNLAHSHGVVACVIAEGREIGVDVEFLDRPKPTHDVANRVCSEDELAAIHAAPEKDQQERFLTFWTLKEAYLKARGLGISVHLADVAFSIEGHEPKFAPKGSLSGADTRWMFRLAQPDPKHLVAVAADTRDGQTPAIRFQRFGAARFPVT
jgi:4'-phosphopantetheinyl transferase